MAITREEIKELKEYYVNELYQNVRSEQKIDQTYRDDTFPVPEIRAPHRVDRSGIGARIVDAPAEQIVTSNPQAFFEIEKGSKESGLKLSKEVNGNWIPILRRLNPNPFKEFVKDELGRGEAYIQVVHNEKWIDEVGTGLPVLFLIPDPMVIYASPEEDENGIPLRVIVFYNRQPRDVIVRYPNWTDPQNKSKRKKTEIEWLEYWDKDYRYFEADGEEILQGENGIQPNIYGFVPFVRQRSGFGRRSPEGKLEDLIVSDIRLSRDLIKQECIKRSNIHSVEDVFAHRPKTIISPGTIDEEEIKKYAWGAYILNVLDSVPEGTKFVEETYPSVPPEMYASHAALKMEIAQRNPFIMAGFPLGTSGRHEDITQMAAMGRYDTVVENTENAFATAFEMALKICGSDIIARPEGLTKKDLQTGFKCSVKLKAANLIEEDRQSNMGSRQFARKEISLKSNLMKFQNYTEDEAEEEITNILVENLTIFNPDVAAVMGMIGAKEMGMEEYIEEAQRRRMSQQAQQRGLQEPLSPTEQRRAEGEVETPLGEEMIDEAMRARGQRRSPRAYFREGGTA